MENVYLLTGRPGVGKTTIVRRILSNLNINAGGFFTEEIRENGVRKGFKLTALDGRETILSHINFHTAHRLGKYGINTQNLDNIGVDAVKRAIKESDLIVIDEIGKMELFSLSFRSTLLQAISSNKKVLGTIMLKPDPFADEIKHRPNVKLIGITVANRDRVVADLLKLLAR